jgi:hypothetical protein
MKGGRAERRRECAFAGSVALLIGGAQPCRVFLCELAHSDAWRITCLAHSQLWLAHCLHTSSARRT